MKKTDDLKKKFLSIIEGGNTITKACKMVNINRSTFYDWRDKDPEFAVQLLYAKQIATETTDEIAGYHYHQRVRQGDRRFVIKWLDERHPEYAKKPLRVVFDHKQNRGDPIVQTATKEELFVRMRAILNSGMVELTDIPKDIELEFLDWYEQNYPGGLENINSDTKDYLAELWKKAYKKGVKIMRTRDMNKDTEED